MSNEKKNKKKRKRKEEDWVVRMRRRFRLADQNEKKIGDLRSFFVVVVVSFSPSTVRYATQLPADRRSSSSSSWNVTGAAALGFALPWQRSRPAARFQHRNRKDFPLRNPQKKREFHAFLVRYTEIGYGTDLVEFTFFCKH